MQVHRPGQPARRMDFDAVIEDIEVDIIPLQVVIAMRHGIDQQFAQRFQRIFAGLLARQPHQAHYAAQIAAHKGLCLVQLFGQRAVNFLLDKAIRHRQARKARRQDIGVGQPLLRVPAE